MRGDVGAAVVGFYLKRSLSIDVAFEPKCFCACARPPIYVTVQPVQLIDGAGSNACSLKQELSIRLKYWSETGKSIGVSIVVQSMIVVSSYKKKFRNQM